MTFHIYPAIPRRGGLWRKQLRAMRDCWRDGEETMMTTKRVSWFVSGFYVKRGKDLLDVVLSIMEKE